MSSATEPYRPQLQRRLMTVMGLYAVVVTAVFALLAMAFAYAVEDEFFSAALRSEVQRQQQHHAQHQRWATPVADFIRIYPAAQGLPTAIAQAIAVNSKRREAVGEAGLHYHFQVLHADGTVIAAEVSSQLVVRPLRQTLLAWLGWSALACIVTALAVAAWLARRTSQPLAQLAARVANSQAELLPQDLSVGLVRDEVGELARHLDALHARVGAFITREQSFTADASHELRTPLAALSLAAEQLRLHCPPQAQPKLEAMQASLWQLQHTLDLLLALARESPDPRPPSEQALLPQVEQVLLAHSHWLEAQGVDISVDVAPDLRRRWPAGFAPLLLGNLLINAVAHRQSPQIRIQADQSSLSISNASLPPPPALLAAGAAGSQSGVKGLHSAGLGMGLSIVRRVAERAGLNLHMRYSDGWTRVTVQEAQAHGSGQPPA